MINRLKSFFQKHSTILIWSFAAAILSSLLMILIVIPQLVQGVKTMSTIADKEAKIKLYQKKATHLKSIDSDYFRQSLAVALTTLPQERDLPALMDEIQVMLGKSNLQIVSVAFTNTPSDQASMFSSFDIKLQVIGDAQALGNFLDQIASAPIILKLSGLSITSSGGGLVEDDMLLTTYYQAAPTSLGSLDQPVYTPSSDDKDLIARLGQNMNTTPLITATVSTRGKSNPFQ